MGREGLIFLTVFVYLLFEYLFFWFEQYKRLKNQKKETNSHTTKLFVVVTSQILEDDPKDVKSFKTILKRLEIDTFLGFLF